MINKAFRMKPDLILKLVAGDGNSLPKSLGLYMDLNHEDVRMRLVSEVKANKDDYVDLW